MLTIVKYIVYRAKKLQKSQRRVFFRAVWRIALVWILTALLIMWICWTNRIAGPDNTKVIVVSGDLVSLREFTAQADSVVFSNGDENYDVTWWGYGGMGPQQVVKKLSQEKEIRLTVFLESNGVVAVQGRTISYLDMEEYNQWHHTNRTLGIIGVSLICTLLTLLFSNDIFRYLKLDGLKYFDPANNR